MDVVETLGVVLDLEARRFEQILERTEQNMVAMAERMRRTATRAIDAHAAAIQRANRIIATIETPFERYQKEVIDLKGLLNQGYITQEHYNRALKNAKQILPQVQAKQEAVRKAQEAANKEIQRAKDIYNQVRTPQERYRQNVREIEGLLARGRITQETYNRALRASQAELMNADNALKRTAGTLKTVGDGMSSLGRTLTFRVTLPLTALAAASVRSFGSFDSAMTNSTSIMEDLSDRQRAAMEKTAKDISRTSATAPAQVAEGYFFLASAGLDAAQSMAALNRVEKFAIAGAFDMSRATELLVDSQTALGMRSKDAEQNLANMTRVADALTEANILSSGTVEQFAAALTNKAANALHLLNKDVEEGVAVLAAFADQGVKGEEAGERLAIVLRDLGNANRKEKKAWDAMGLAVFDARGKMLPIVNIVEQLEQKLGTMSDQQKAATFALLGFQDRSVSALKTLVGTSDRIREYEDKLRSAGGVTDKVANKQLQSFNNQMKMLRNQLLIAAEDIGKTLVPIIAKLTEFVKSAVKWWEGLNQSTKETIVTLGLVAAAAGPVLMVMGSMTSSAAQLVKTFGMLGMGMSEMVGVAGLAKAGLAGLAIAGIAAVSYSLYQAMPSIRAFNAELEKSRKLSIKANAQLEKRNAKSLETAKTEGPLALEAELKRAKVEAAGVETQMAHTQKQIDEFGTIAHAVGNKVLVGLQEHMKDLETRSMLAADHVDNVEQALKNFSTGGNEATQSMRGLDDAFEGNLDTEGTMLDKLDELNKKFKEQASSFNSTSREAEIMAVKLQGATDEQLKYARSVDVALTAQERARESNRELINTFGQIRDLQTRAIGEDPTGHAARQTEIWQRMMEGASSEEIRWRKEQDQHLTTLEKYKKSLEDGRRAVEQYEKPAQKFARRQQELMDLFKAGTIDVGTFERAMRDVRKDLANNPLEVKIGIQGIEAVEVGTAEAMDRWLEFSEKAKQDWKVLNETRAAGMMVAATTPAGGVGTAGSTKETRVEDILTRINDTLLKQESSRVVVKPLGL